MSSTISWHIEKHVSGDVGGLQIHNQRLTDHHTNKRIDVAKSHENLHAQSIRQKFGEMSYSERINQEIENRYLGKRKIRSNAIVDVEHTIQFGGDQFEKLSRDQKNQLMMSATKFVAEKFGGWQNVLDWNAHLDETNDHAHMDMIPLTEDGRLSAKDLYSKGTLQIVQNELLTHMQELYPEMDFKRADKTERGFANGKTQKDYERLKSLSDANKDDLKQVEALKNEITESIRDIEPDFKVKDDDYERAFQEKGEMSDDVFYAKYGYQPEPVKNATGFDQVKDFFNLKQLKSKFINVWKRFKQKFEKRNQDKENEFKTRENNIKIQMDELNQLKANRVEQSIDLIHENFGTFDEFTKTNIDFLVSWNRTRQFNFDSNNQDFLHEDEKKLVEKYELTPEKITELTIKNKFNTRLAELAIALGVHESWRDSMINNGAQMGETSKGYEINKPFSMLIPELLENATTIQLQAAKKISHNWRQDYNNPHHGRSL